MIAPASGAGFAWRARWETAARAALFVLLVGAVYWPARHGNWVWDDDIEIARNTALRQPASVLTKIWLAPATPDYFPLKATAQWVEWRLWGARRAGYHWANVALQALSALLFVRLLRKIFALRGGGREEPLDDVWANAAWVGGALFAVHPLAVESVAWVAEFKNVLSLPLFLLAADAYVRFGESGRRRDYGVALACFLAAMLSKSSVVMFPVVALLYEIWRRGRITRAAVVRLLPFFAISLALGLVTIEFQMHRTVAGSAGLEGWGGRSIAAGLATAFYLGKCLWPAHLLPIYPRWTVVPPSLVQLLPWPVLLGAWFWMGRRPWGRHGRFALGFFVVNLIPVLGFVPMAYSRISWVADHFAYLPMLGLIGFAAAGYGWIESRVPRVAQFFVPVVLLAFMSMSRREAATYANNEVFWTRAYRGNPGSWTVDNNLGIALTQAGRPTEAVPMLQAALRLKPEDADTWYNLGLAWADAGERDKARSAYAAALRFQPGFPRAENNLGKMLAEDGRGAEARACFEAAVKGDPEFAEARNNLGLALARAGETDEAIREYREAVRLDPDYAEAFGNLGDALARSGRAAEALPAYAEALRCDPGLISARVNLSNTLLSLGRLEEAIAGYEAVLRLEPGNRAARENIDLVRAREATGSPAP